MVAILDAKDFERLMIRKTKRRSYSDDLPSVNKVKRQATKVRSKVPYLTLP